MKVTLFILKIMSTFGKKHITYWNYEPTGDINDINGLYLGFQKSPKEVQLKILLAMPLIKQDICEDRPYARAARITITN